MKIAFVVLLTSLASIQHADSLLSSQSTWRILKGTDSQHSCWKDRWISSYTLDALVTDLGTGASEVQDDDEDERKQKDRHARFAGVGRLYARESVTVDDTALEPHLSVVDRLAQAAVCVIGIGGVGSWAAEALCRSGIGNLILIDLDDICISNTNRQLHTTSSSIGRLKTDEMQRRLVDINPNCNVTLIHDFVMVDNVYEMLGRMMPELDVVLDCIDGAKEKTALLAACTELGIAIVTCGGAAGKLDPTKVVADDLTRVLYDPLLALCRKNLRREHGFEKGLSFKQQVEDNIKPRKWRIPAVFSTETPKQVPNQKKSGVDASTLRRCDGALGTACFVTGTFGFVAASEVVDMIAKGKGSPPRKGNQKR